jgi:membrane protease YdiL (CAAX protease family)
MNNNHSIEKANIAWPFALLSNILIVLGFILVANWAGGVCMYLYLGRIPTESDFITADPDLITLVKHTLLAGQIGGTLVGLVVLPLLYVFYLKRELKGVIFNSLNAQLLPFIGAGIGITFVILPLIGIIGDWNKSITLPESWNSMEVIMRAMELKAEKMTKLIVYYHSLSEGIMVFFTVALLPAIAEELVFRGILQNDLLKYTGNVHIAVFISAAIFSFIHLQFFGFFPRLLLGIILGYLYITSGNIIVSILMHFLNNAMVIVALNLYAQGTLKMDPESSKDLPKESVYLSILLSSALFYLCWSMYKQRTNTERTNV